MEKDRCDIGLKRHAVVYKMTQEFDSEMQLPVVFVVEKKNVRRLSLEKEESVMTHDFSLEKIERIRGV